jgi:hypothetical protein
VNGAPLRLDAWLGEMLRLWTAQLRALRAHLEAHP